MYLGRPRGLGIGVNLGIEALNELASQSRSLFRREPQCRIQQLPRIHTERLPPTSLASALANTLAMTRAGVGRESDPPCVWVHRLVRQPARMVHCPSDVHD